MAPLATLARRSFIAGLAAATCPLRAAPVLRVGPGREFTSLAAAARAVRDGDIVEVDAGEYRGDVATWARDGLRLRAVGGRVRLRAEGEAAQGKGIWVVRGRGIQVEGFDFEGARVPSRNGAGIRFESGSLTVRDCRFIDNEMGLLTNNEPDAELVVEMSEFAHNQRPDGHNHNLYVGSIRSLTIRGSHLHHASTGHLLKSRAASNHVMYNRLTDEPGGSASYELEFPNGGRAWVVGNLIQQNVQTRNPIMVSFGAEGYRDSGQSLVCAFNTLVDDGAEGGSFVRVMPGSEAVALKLLHNVFCGKGPYELTGAPAEQRGNLRVERAAFADADALDLRLRAAVARPPAVDLQADDPVPAFEYSHPRRLQPLTRRPRVPGALQDVAA